MSILGIKAVAAPLIFSQRWSGPLWAAGEVGDERYIARDSRTAHWVVAKAISAGRLAHCPISHHSSDCVINDEHDDCADDRDEHAVQIETGHPGRAEKRK
jgi:hypothetical protein